MLRINYAQDMDNNYLQVIFVEKQLFDNQLGITCIIQIKCRKCVEPSQMLGRPDLTANLGIKLVDEEGAQGKLSKHLQISLPSKN